LGYQWSLGSLPSDPKRLAKLVDWDAKSFNSAWQTVGEKFEVIDGRLLNSRLEQHRQRSAELSRKNAEAGKKGAEAKWRIDGERQQSANGEQVANAKETPPQDANGVTDGNPSHPIPSHVIQSRSRGSKGTRKAPPDFKPDLDFARRELPDINAEAEAERFMDFEFARARSDWPATWRNWIRTARDRGDYAKRSKNTDSPFAHLDMR
jgi:hypothetical protein